MNFALELGLDIVRLLTVVAAGVMAGTLLEATGVMKRVAYISGPMLKLGKLSPVCGTAFVTAFASPRAANSILASAYSEQSLSRRELISGALVNLFPGSLTHLRVLAFVLIPLLGVAGVAYVLFQIITGFICALTALIASSLLAGGSKQSTFAGTKNSGEEEQKKSLRDALKEGWKRARKMLIRVICITVPIYVAVAVLEQYGVFSSLTEYLPQSMTHILPPAGITVVAAHLSSVINAAGVASELLGTGTLSSAQVFLTLVCGYVLSMPIRVMRHTIPAAVGIYPYREALLIVIAGQSLRLFFTLVCGTLIFVVMNGF